MKNEDSAILYRVSWKWHAVAWLDMLLGIALCGALYFSNHINLESYAVYLIAIAILIISGIGLLFICFQHVVIIGKHEISAGLKSFHIKRYKLEGVLDVRIRGPYLTLDFGSIPRPVILLLNDNPKEIFGKVSDIAHNLPSGTFVTYLKK